MPKTSHLTLKTNRPLPNSFNTLLQNLKALSLKKEILIKTNPTRLDKIIEARITGKVFLLRRLITCGKTCSSCPHGPYWYGFYRSNGKVISFYLGKQLPPRFQEAQKISINTNPPSEVHKT